MKKIAVFAAMLLIGSLLLAGCASASPIATNAATTAAATAPAEGGTSAALQQVVDASQGAIESMVASFDGTMDLAITARGNALVYTFKYLVDVGDASAVKTALEEATKAQDAVYGGLVSTLSAAGVPSPSVIVEYLDKDGAMIYSLEHK